MQGGGLRSGRLPRRYYPRRRGRCCCCSWYRPHEEEQEEIPDGCPRRTFLRWRGAGAWAFIARGALASLDGLNVPDLQLEVEARAGPGNASMELRHRVKLGH